MTLHVSNNLKTDLLNNLVTDDRFFQEGDDVYAKYDQINILFHPDRTTTVTFYYQNKVVASMSSPVIEPDCPLHITNLFGGIKFIIENP